MRDANFFNGAKTARRSVLRRSLPIAKMESPEQDAFCPQHPRRKIAEGRGPTFMAKRARESHTPRHPRKNAAGFPPRSVGTGQGWAVTLSGCEIFLLTAQVSRGSSTDMGWR